ncbi:MAG: YdiU family protein [Pseudomonadota bacterium]
MSTADRPSVETIISPSSLQNSYASLPEPMYARVAPVPVAAPTLLAWNAPLAEELGLAHLATSDDALAELFSGNRLPEGAEPIALAYAGHQFGYFNRQLGDGRAVLLGDVVDSDGHRRDVQLKGSGRTPFSRGGDGRSSLGPVIREYLLSEAMYALGVPTTRALAAVQTGEQVLRELPLPGGVFTRVASSHVRIGTFEYFASRGERDNLKALADFAITRHAPDLADTDRPYLEFFKHVVDAQVSLVAHWMDLGFIHGVMNTDNTSVSGETIDYGPCAFMDEFNASKVFSSIDHQGRYAFDQQPHIILWNLMRLAECLSLLDDGREAFEDVIDDVLPRFESLYFARLAKKLGFTSDSEVARSLAAAWLAHLQEHALDYTLSFRRLADRLDADGDAEFGAFESGWRAAIDAQGRDTATVRTAMNAVNPLFIPRNHQVERAIQGAIDSDLSVFNELRSVLARPFDEQADFADYAKPPVPEERVTRTFCGT